MNWNGEIIGNIVLGKIFFICSACERTKHQTKKNRRLPNKTKKKKEINTESIRKLSNFYFIEGYKCNKLYETTSKKRFLCEPKKTNFKSFKFHKMKSYAWWFYLCFPNSCEIWNLFCLAPIRNCLWCYYR